MDNEELLLGGNLSELKIVLIGAEGAGKISLIETIQRSTEGIQEPTSKAPADTQRIKFRDQCMVFFNTPDLCSTEREDEEVMQEIRKRVSTDHPSLFLFVLNVSTFTKSEQETVKLFTCSFGEKVLSYTMVLFTGGDELKKRNKNIKQFIEANHDLQSFVNKCNGYHVIDNKDQSPTQVTELLDKIKSMVQKKAGNGYTADMLEEVKETAKGSQLKKKIALSVNSSAVVGAGLGGVISHFSGGTFGVPVAVSAGAAVGGVMGGVGIVAAEHLRHKMCKQQ